MTITTVGTAADIRLPERTSLDPGSLLRFEDALLGIFRTVFRPTAYNANRIDKAGYVTLARLGRCGAVRLSDLAALMELDLSTVSRQVKTLEGIGMVARTSDPDDRRAAVVDLTDAGRRELAQQREARFQTLDAAFGQMSPRDRDRLVDLLDRLAGSVAGSVAEAACTTTTGKALR